jgi:hypothetical protein
VERLVLARVEEPELADALERLERLSGDEVMGASQQGLSSRPNR